MTQPHHIDNAEQSDVASWGEMLRGANLARSIALTGGVGLQAVNNFIATTILPSVVKELGGLQFYAWNTTLYAVSSIFGSILSGRILTRFGPRYAYACAATIFAIGALICALAPSMPILLLGRSVEGLGGGVLAALAYSVIRRVFRKPLWPLALAMISGMWGFATLIGPAVGGVFAEIGDWRAAFWTLIIAAIVFTIFAFVSLPRDESADRRRTTIPLVQMALLAAAVFAASFSSLGSSLNLTVAAMMIAGTFIILLLRVEHQAEEGMFPRGALTAGSKFALLYSVLGLLTLGTSSSQIFVPLFLQTLHGHAPLVAGYMAACVSIGWSVAAFWSSSRIGEAQRAVVRSGPIITFIGLSSLAVLIPLPAIYQGMALMTAIILALFATGVGLGLSHPHVLTRILSTASHEEADSAASAISTIRMCSVAFGSALAGLVVNIAGASSAMQTFDAAHAARWLFIFAALCSLACSALVWRNWR